MSKFHQREIKKGVYGELSKIQEELDEARDAEEQGQRLMLLIELSDIVGAVAGVANKYGFTLEHLCKFAELRSKVARAELGIAEPVLHFSPEDYNAAWREAKTPMVDKLLKKYADPTAEAAVQAQIENKTGEWAQG